MAESEQLVLLESWFKPIEEQLDYQILLQKTFQKINAKTNEYYRNRSHHSINPPSCLQESIELRFKKDLLPSLRDRIVSLCDIFKHSNVHDSDPALICQATFETMLHIDEVLNQIMSTITYITKASDEIRDGPYAGLMEKCDQFEPLDYLDRWSTLIKNIDDLIEYVGRQFQSFENFSQKIETLRDIKDESYYNRQTRSVWTLRSSITSRIGELIEAISKSETIAFQYELKSMARKLNPTQRIFTYLLVTEVNGTLNPEKIGYIRTVNAFIPIVKLGYLLINKISKTTNSHLHPIWQVNVTLQGYLFHDLGDMMSSINTFVQDELNPSGRDPDPAKHLADIVNTSVKAIKVLNQIFQYYPHRPEVKESRDWCKVWAGQFDVAVKNFIRASENSSI